MKEMLIAAALLAVTPAVLASETCPRVSKESWLRPEEVQSRLQARGFDVRRVKREGNCYEVSAVDSQGRKVKAYVNPADASIVKEKVKS